MSPSVGIAIRPLAPNLRTSSGSRCDALGYQLRAALSGSHAGVKTPKRLSSASASAARTSARIIEAMTTTSATSSWMWLNCSMPIASVISDSSPRNVSVLAVVRAVTWWVMWTTALVSV
jgi:hypothetical protein